jgi:hypothetical protein
MALLFHLKQVDWLSSTETCSLFHPVPPNLKTPQFQFHSFPHNMETPLSLSHLFHVLQLVPTYCIWLYDLSCSNSLASVCLGTLLSFHILKKHRGFWPKFLLQRTIVSDKVNKKEISTVLRRPQTTVEGGSWFWSVPTYSFSESIFHTGQMV